MIEHRFTAAAATYDRHNCPQRELGERLLTLLPATSPHRILDVGAGTGLLTQYLLERYPEASIDALDIAPGMVDVGRERFQQQSRVTWKLGDARQFTSSHRYDLIVSNAALQWMPSLPSALSHLVEQLEPGGVLGIGMMLSETLSELHALRACVAPQKPFPLQLPRWCDVLDALHRHGLKVIESDHLLNQIEYENASSFLRVLHDQGVTGGVERQGGKPLNRSELRRLVALYEELHSSASGVVATYDYGVVIAIKS